MESPDQPLPALEEALLDPPAVPQVRDESDLAGLARRRVRSVDLIGHSVAVVAPSASALVTPFIMLRVVGPGAWLSAVIGFGLAFLLTSVFAQFATRVAAPGSMYTWVTRSIGPLCGLLVATSMLLGYGTLVAFGVSQSVRSGADAAISSGMASPGGGAQLVGAVVVVLVCLAISVRGVALSTRVALAAEATLVLSLAGLVVATLAREGLALGGLLSLEGADPSRILLGAAIVMSITVGFESSAALAGEADRPFLSVPRALGGTVVVSALLYALAYVATHAVVVQGGWHLGGPAQRWFPNTVDAHHADTVLSVLLCLGYAALALCSLNAVARVTFSLARERLLPSVLGRTHPRWHSPYGALIAVAPFAVVPAGVTAVAGDEVRSLTHQLLSAAVLVLVIAYALVAVAVPFLLARLGEWTWPPVLLAATAAALALTVSVVDVAHDLEDGRWLAVVLAGVALLGGAGWYAGLRVRAVGALHRMGIHDETISSDLLHR